MNKIKIGNLDITNISMGAGTGKLGKSEENLGYEILDEYLAAGGNCIDTARMYSDGENEQYVGDYLKNRNCRKSIILSTKCAYPTTPHVSRLSEGDINADIETSLKKLQTDYVDLFFLHRDDPNIDVSQIMPTLHKLITDGKVRALGASNWTVGRINMANKFALENNLTPFSVSQMHFSLALTTPPLTKDLTHVVMNDTEFMWYYSNQFPVMAFATQARGFFAKTLSGMPLTPSPEAYYCSLEENYRRTDRLKELACQLNVTPSALANAYIMCQPLPTIALCGFSSSEQLHDSLTAMNINLTEKEILFLEKGII